MLDLNGGTSLLGDALSITVFVLKQSFYRGKYRVKRFQARQRLNGYDHLPINRLHIDGETFYE